MSYKHTMNLFGTVIDAYAMNFKDNLPTRFQIFISGRFEGFIYYDDGWKSEIYPLSNKSLNEDMTEIIGEYLMGLYQ